MAFIHRAWCSSSDIPRYNLALSSLPTSFPGPHTAGSILDHVSWCSGSILDVFSCLMGDTGQWSAVGLLAQHFNWDRRQMGLHVSPLYVPLRSRQTVLESTKAHLASGS